MEEQGPMGMMKHKIEIISKKAKQKLYKMGRQQKRESLGGRRCCELSQ